MPITNSWAATLLNSAPPAVSSDFTANIDAVGQTAAAFSPALPEGASGLMIDVSTTPAGQQVEINGALFPDGARVYVGFAPGYTSYETALRDLQNNFVAGFTAKTGSGVTATLTGKYYHVQGDGSQPPPADTTAPTIALLNGPITGATESTELSFLLRVSDAVGVNTATIDSNTIVVKRPDSSPVTTAISLSGTSTAANATVTFTPDVVGTHTIEIASGIADTSGNVLGAIASLSTFDVAAAGDTIAPTIALLNGPITGATISDELSFTLRVSDAVAVDPSTINTGTIIVRRPDGEAIARTIALSGPATASDAEVTITPGVAGLYAIEIAAGITDTAGNSLSAIASLATFNVAPAPVETTLNTAVYDEILEAARAGPELEITLSNGDKRVVYPEIDTGYEGAAIEPINNEFLVKNNGSGREYYARFNLSNVTGTVTAAQLNSYVGEIGSPSQRLFIIKPAVDTWDASTLNRTNRPADGETVFDAIVPENSWVEADVTTSVQAAIAGNNLVSYNWRTDQNSNIALSTRLHNFTHFDAGSSTRVQANAHDKFNMVNSQVFFLLALAVNQNATATSSTGILLKDRLMEYVRVITTSGNGPDASSRIQGWSQGFIGHGLLLAMQSPTALAEFTATELNRAVGTLQAFAYGATWSYADGNSFIGDIGGNGDTRSFWNPNHYEGALGAVIDEALRTSGTAVDTLLANFDFDTAVANFNSAGLTNIATLWAQNTAANVNDFGSVRTITDRGEGRGVYSPFAYSGSTADVVSTIPGYNVISGAGLSTPCAIFYNMAARMYSWEVVDTVRGIYTYINPNAGPSPTLGQVGMLHELDTSDASGRRSDIKYCLDGVRNSVATACTLIANGEWGVGLTSAQLTDLEARMTAGLEDFFHKVDNGWDGWSNGNSKPYTAADLGFEYSLCKLTWFAFLKPELEKPNPVSPLIGNVNPAYNVDTDLQLGDVAWSDRTTYTMFSIPAEIIGGNIIQSPKSANTNTDPVWLSFTLDRPANVYVARQGVTPTWLADWTDLGEQTTTTTDGISAARSMDTYRKAFPAGLVELPGHALETGGSAWTYLVMVAE